MKIFHKKFLNQEEFRDTTQGMSVNDKTKTNYWLNQAVIWILIFAAVFVAIKFLNNNF